MLHHGFTLILMDDPIQISMIHGI